MWKLFLKGAEKPILSIIWYVLMFGVITGAPQVYDNLEAYKIKNIDISFFGLRADYAMYISIIGMSVVFAGTTIYKYLKSDRSQKSLKISVIIHCIGIALFLIVVGLNIYTL